MIASYIQTGVPGSPDCSQRAACSSRLPITGPIFTSLQLAETVPLVGAWLMELRRT